MAQTTKSTIAGNLLRISIGLAVAFIFLGIRIQLFHDAQLMTVEAEPDAPSVKIPPVEENGHVVLTRGLENGKWPEITIQQQEMLDQSKPWDPAVMLPLAEAGPAMRICVENALSHPEWHCNPKNTGNYRGLWESVAILSAQARQMVSDEALDEAMSCMRDAHLMMGRMPPQCMGFEDIRDIIRSREMMDSTLTQLAASPRTPRGMLVEITNLISAPVMHPEYYRRAVRLQRSELFYTELPVRENPRHEFCEMLRLATGSKLPDWFILTRYKEHATANLYAVHLTRLAQLGLHGGTEYRTAAKEFRDYLSMESRRSLLSHTPNRAGSVRMAILVSTYARDEARLFSMEACRRCRLAVMAVKCRIMDQEGGRPETLAELVPDYLPTVPLDPYDGKPLRWVRGSGQAYVSGDDGAEEVPVMRPDLFSASNPNGSWAALP